MFSKYILILVWVGFMAIVSAGFYRVEYNELTEAEEWRVIPLFALIAFFPIIWMAGHRGWDGYFDTGLYIRSFWDVPARLSELPAYLQTLSKDKGFYVLSAFIKIVFGYDEDVYFTVIALLQGLCIVKLFRKYSPDYMMSVFLFVASTDYLSGMFNGIRQFMAAAIIYAATPLMLKKKYIPMIICILFASFFHKSAVIMIPIVIIAQGKAWNKKTLLFIAGILLSVAFVGRFTNILNSALMDTQYVNVVSDYTAMNDDGTNPLRVLVYSIPCIISFLLRKKIDEESDPLIHFCTNMSIVTMGLYVLSMFTSGIFLGRLPIFCNLFCYILLPWEMENILGCQYKKMMNAIMVGCYLLFYYYIIHFQYGLI